MRTTILTIIVIACSFPASAQTLTGTPYVIDADTITIGHERIRLQGIDAPETDQICLDSKGVVWSCGTVAHDRLIQHIGGTRRLASPAARNAPAAPPSYQRDNAPDRGFSGERGLASLR